MMETDTKSWVLMLLRQMITEQDYLASKRYGTVKNLGIEAVRNGGTTNDFIGGIAGSVNEGGTIDKCYNKATISGKSA